VRKPFRVVKHGDDFRNDPKERDFLRPRHLYLRGRGRRVGYFSGSIAITFSAPARSVTR
jgi:hypothetical protein